MQMSDQSLTIWIFIGTIILGWITYLSLRSSKNVNVSDGEAIQLIVMIAALASMIIVIIKNLLESM